MSISDDDWMRNYGRYSTIAFQMIVIILAGVFLGYKIDQWLHLNKHYFLVFFSFLFGFLALYFMLRDLLKNK
jgi:F0F1-type ATP synthase assembly protein I